jgi:DNA mismatch endonuclease (patch repair protein)
VTETPEQRSRIMRAVKGRDTAPEMLVRRMAHGMGYRHRLHRKDLPGKPDLVFPSRRKVVFVHGCFWHGHECKRGARMPKANRDYWQAKIARNRMRDKKNQDSLRNMGWRVLEIWECEAKDTEALAAKLRAFLEEMDNSGTATCRRTNHQNMA